MNSSSTPTIQLQQSGDLPLLLVNNCSASAVIALQGAQVLRYQRQGTADQPTQPLLWLSDLAAYQRGQSVRGGIPVCWPWFGDLDRNPAAVQQQYSRNNAPAPAPAHGLVRSCNWLIDSCSELDDETHITLRCPTAEMNLGNIELLLQITIGDSLRLQLRTTNNGNSNFVFTQALHSYFAISDIHTAAVEGLENTRYIETLENWTEKKQHGAVTFSGETDRIYLDIPEHIDIVDTAWQRNIQLYAKGSRSAVVWNPWIEKSKRLSQFAPEAWQHMLCIESANVLDDCIALAPAESHTLALTIAEKILPAHS